MPLMDHFHQPLAPRRHWEALHARWASALSDALNAVLPANYFAEPQTHAGNRVEVDVATFESPSEAAPRPNGAVATAVAPKVWAPPDPDLTVPATFPATFTVRVFGTEPGGLELVGAIELVSPGNKDRAEDRRAFVVKCASYLVQGVGLVVVDIVTSRSANLHNEMMQLLALPPSTHLPPTPLYAVAYRPLRRDGQDEIDFWRNSFAVGDPLPILPLALGKGLVPRVDLEATYTEACRHLRIA